MVAKQSLNERTPTQRVSEVIFSLDGKESKQISRTVKPERARESCRTNTTMEQSLETIHSSEICLTL